MPFHQGPESNATSLLDIDDRSLKCNAQCVEVSNSKKLIEYTMEENYRLLFGEPSLERKREVGKDRFRNTIIRKFGRHRAKEKIERLPSMVRYSKIYWTKLHAFLILLLWMSVFLFPFLLCVRFLLRLCHSNLKVELLPTDSSAAVEFIRTEKIAKSAENLKLFRSYEEHIDRLISQALLNGIESRYVCCCLYTTYIHTNSARFAALMCFMVALSQATHNNFVDCVMLFQNIIVNIFICLPQFCGWLTCPSMNDNPFNKAFKLFLHHFVKHSTGLCNHLHCQLYPCTKHFEWACDKWAHSFRWAYDVKISTNISILFCSIQLFSRVFDIFHLLFILFFVRISCFANFHKYTSIQHPT